MAHVILFPNNKVIDQLVALVCGLGSSVGIATDYGLDGPAIESWWGRPWGPPSLLYNGYRVFPGGKVQLGCAADNSPLFSAEVLGE
jgi:hypothetical protein